MSRDAFRRLALLTCGSAYALGLALAWTYLGWAITVITVIGGVAVTLAVTLEETPRPPAPPAREPEGLSRRDIARLATPVEDDLE